MRISDWSSDVCSSDLVLAAQGVNRSLQDITGRQLVDQLTAAGATGIGVDERACHRLGRPAFVPQQDRQAKVCEVPGEGAARLAPWRFRSGEHTSELQSLMRISYAVFFLQKKTKNT